MPERPTPRGVAPWLPAAVLALGAGAAAVFASPRTIALQAPLAALPDTLLGARGTAVTLPDDVLRVAAPSDYLLREYRHGSAPAFSLYVGWYATQAGGRAIHSPKNCLPGSGWEPVSAGRVMLAVPGRGSVEVNRYVIANRGQRALVYYWYQGRGLVEAGELRVKLALMFDTMLRRRSDEALVRLVFMLPPVDGPAAAAPDPGLDARASEAAARVVAALDGILPGA